ncbi:MAG TPA: lysophospholipid acyltransferase family protein [Streptosporangiaceae bacterium]|nr:lysophospholipid acyltransferase family protein [Streptosporangiaceae bacterium]
MTGEQPSLPGGWLKRLAAAAEFARRRLDGGYEVDAFGFDPELNAAVMMPAALALYQRWFRIQMRGLEHIPATGAALVVANHSGVLPLDAIMLQAGIFAEHPQARNLRVLGADMVYSLPVLATLARRSGHVRANPEQALGLLAAGELVGVFPEGFKGIGKPFSERYRLQRFGRGGFARTAVQAGAPIIPCAIVGAEEIYPMIGNAEPVARALRLPYFPVTPLFPWLGPVGAIPLPSKWIIEFSEPVQPPSEATAEPDDDTVAKLADQVRDIIQDRLDELVIERGPAFE